jgi:hypothetical protein
MYPQAWHATPAAIKTEHQRYCKEFKVSKVKTKIFFVTTHTYLCTLARFNLYVICYVILRNYVILM